MAEHLEPARRHPPEASTATLHPFDVDIGIERISDNSFAATITDRWNVNSGNPNGGYLLALCARALTATIDTPDALALSAHYLSAAAPGDAQITTEVARTGRRLATAEARLVQHGREILRVIGTFADLRQRTGATWISDPPLRLPAPESCVDPMTAGPIPGVTIADQVDYRYPEMPGWRVGRPSGDPRAAFWMRFRQPRTPDLIGLACLADAGAAAVMELGAAGSTTVQLSAYMHAQPATEWVACRVSTRHVVGGYHEEDVELWDATGAFVAQARQLAIVR